MNFVNFRPEGRLRTPEQVAKVIYDVALSMAPEDLDEVGKAAWAHFYAQCTVACTKVESDFWCPWNAADPTSKNYDHDSQSDDGRSVGYFQQQNAVPGDNPPSNANWWGTMKSRMTLEDSARVFISRMRDGYDYSHSVYDIGQMIADTQGCAPAYRGRYAEEWAAAGEILANALNGASAPTQPQEPPAKPEEPPVADSKKPAFNEFPIWTGASQSRNGAKPRLALVHTQEPSPAVNHGPPPNDAAERLAAFCQDLNHEASYHNYISQAADGGVTVINGVDTDLASWSVGNANDYSLNYCIAYSYAGWTTEEWMRYAGNAIDVLAYLIVQDAKKYGFDPEFLGTGGDYTTNDPNAHGVADHKFVTDVIGWGNHQDVGPNFPKEYFAERLAYWFVGGESQAPPPVEPPAPEDPNKLFARKFFGWVTDRKNTTDRDLLEYLVLQIGTGHPDWPSSGRTVRDQLFYGDDPT